MKPANIIFFLIAAGLFFLLLNNWPWTGTNEQHTLRAGNRYFEDGLYHKASESFQSIIKNNPENIDALRGLARSYMQLGKHHEALVLFNQAIAQSPNYAPSYANRGILHDRMQQYSFAVDDYKRALQLQPELAKGPHWLTRFLRNQAERPPSIEDRLKYLQQELQKPEADRLRELRRRRAGAAFAAVHGDEIRVDAAFQHRLADREKLVAAPDAQFEADGFSAGQFAQPGEELEQLERR